MTNIGSDTNTNDSSSTNQISKKIVITPSTSSEEERTSSSSGGRDRKRMPKKDKEFEERLLEVRRVTRVATGGRQIAFRAIILIGNKKGKIGLGVAKANDVLTAIQKATRDAKKHIVSVPITDNDSIPYAITHKYKASIIKLLPAAQGTGLKAGSSVRSVLELAGYNNMLSKIVGTNNVLINALSTIEALQTFKV